MIGLIAVYGTGGHGREIAWMIEKQMSAERGGTLVGFVDDDMANIGKTINGFEVFSLERLADEHCDAQILCAVGAPRVRERLARKCEDRGFSFATLLWRGAELSPQVSIGEGSVLCEGTVITTNVSIGRHVHINIGAAVSSGAHLFTSTTSYERGLLWIILKDRTALRPP